jgi:hypothetical protein
MKIVKLLTIIAIATLLTGGLAFAGAGGRVAGQDLQRRQQQIEIRRQQMAAGVTRDPNAVVPGIPTPTPQRPPIRSFTPTPPRIAAAPLRNEMARILVIPTPGMKLPEIVAIKEDLAIMSRILDRAVAPDVIEPIAIESTEDSQSLIQFIREAAPQSARQNLTESVFIAGFGVVFSMRINFPLIPPPQGLEPKVGGQETGNIWEQTRQELYSSSAGGRGPAQEASIRQAQRPPFDARRVEEFKGKLTESFKQASNIRSLRPDDSVTITVTSPGVQLNPIMRGPEQPGEMDPEQLRFFMQRAGGGGGDEAVTANPELEEQKAKFRADQEFFLQRFGSGDRGGAVAGVRPFAQNCLIIKAKKADIDGFAKGTINLETFKQRLEIITY